MIIFYAFLLAIVHPVSSNAETSTETISNYNITKIENSPPFYDATVFGQCPDSKILTSEPYLVFQNNCIEEAIITGVGPVTNNLTFTNIVIDNKTIFGKGNGTIFTPEG
ncbi:MAG: hypothetical protein ACPKPY_05370, partial [Nitrososphaeraceae archaeon]